MLMNVELENLLYLRWWSTFAIYSFGEVVEPSCKLASLKSSSYNRLLCNRQQCCFWRKYAAFEWFHQQDYQPTISTIFKSSNFTVHSTQQDGFQCVVSPFSLCNAFHMTLNKGEFKTFYITLARILRSYRWVCNS